MCQIHDLREMKRERQHSEWEKMHEKKGYVLMWKLQEN